MHGSHDPVGLGRLTAVAEKTPQAHRGAQLPRPRPPLRGERERAPQGGLGLRLVAGQAP